MIEQLFQKSNGHVEMSLKLLSDISCFGGQQKVYQHYSNATGTNMKFSVFIPLEASREISNPALFFLSGLTCTWENVTTKAGAQESCAEAGLIFIAPDTSPRGDRVADSPDYDLGQGAGFYLDATQDPWKTNFKMETYIMSELYELVIAEFGVDKNSIGVTGHSMGGHGALTLALKHPEKFKSLSAFSPIVNPINCPWGQKAFVAYLGENTENWSEYDACSLLNQRGWSNDILIDQGLADEFLNEQLKPENFEKVCQTNNVDLSLRLHENYDHSYYFISTFMKDHIKWHSSRLKKN